MTANSIQSQPVRTNYSLELEYHSITACLQCSVTANSIQSQSVLVLFTIIIRILYQPCSLVYYGSSSKYKLLMKTWVSLNITARLQWSVTANSIQTQNVFVLFTIISLRIYCSNLCSFSIQYLQYRYNKFHILYLNDRLCANQKDLLSDYIVLKQSLLLFILKWQII